MKVYKKQKFLASRLQRPVAARNDVIAKNIDGGLFQNLSGWPEDWTVSGPCHLYREMLRPINKENNLLLKEQKCGEHRRS